METMTLDDITICINSSNRADKVCTHKQFSKKIKDHMLLIVPYDQFEAYEKYKDEGLSIIKLPASCPPYIASQRQWVIENIQTDYMFVMDDDLYFNFRDSNKKLKIPSEQILDKMIHEICVHLEEVPMVGISPRGGNNNVVEDYIDITRVFRCYCFDRRIFLKLNIRFNPYEPFIMEDFWVILHWLRAGYKNRVLYTYAQGEKGGSNSSGGCSIFRTDEVQEKAVNFIKSTFPDVVTIKKKITKNAWRGFKTNKKGEMIRTDVIIHWKKAYKQKHNLSTSIQSFFEK
jgi:hypothetical protein